MTALPRHRGGPSTGFVGARPRQRSLLFGIVTLLALAGPAREAQGQRRRHTPWPRLYRAAGSDHRKHIAQRLPLPVGTEIKAGRFFGSSALPRGPRVRARPADFFLRSARLLVTLRASDGALLGLAAPVRAVDPTAADFVEVLRGAAPAVCDRQGRHATFLQSIRVVGTPPALETRARVAGGPELELTTRYRLLGTPGHAPDALEIDSTLVHRDTARRSQVRLCERLQEGDTEDGDGDHDDGRAAGGLRAFVASGGGSRHWVLRGTGPLWVERSGSGLRVHHARVDLAPGESLRTRRLLVAAMTTRSGTRLALVARAAAWAGERWSGATLQLPATRPANTRLLLLHEGRRVLGASLQTRVALPTGKGWSLALRVPGAGHGPPLPLDSGRSKPLVLALPVLTRLELAVRDARRQPLAAQLSLQAETLATRPHRRVSLGDTTLWLAPGRYTLTVARPDGRHRSVRRELTLVAGRSQKSTVTLPAAFVTPGWSALDTRLRTRRAGAWRAAAAAGLDAAVIADLGSGGRRPPSGVKLLAIGGQELAPRLHRFGRFVAFPLPAILDDEVETPAELFAAARKAGAQIVVATPWEARHGYFALLGVDAQRGRAASSHYDERFELLEVLSGSASAAEEERALASFLSLVARGKHVRATAGAGPGPYGARGPRDWPRLLLPWPASRTTPPAAPTVEALLAALKRGRSVATRGPHVTVRDEPSRLMVQLRAVVDDAARARPAALELYQGRRLADRVPIPLPRAGLLLFRHTFARSGPAARSVLVVRGASQAGDRGRLLAVVNPP